MRLYYYLVEVPLPQPGLLLDTKIRAQINFFRNPKATRKTEEYGNV
jgi:hypothetical protein